VRDLFGTDLGKLTTLLEVPLIDGTQQARSRPAVPSGQAAFPVIPGQESRCRLNGTAARARRRRTRDAPTPTSTRSGSALQFQFCAPQATGQPIRTLRTQRRLCARVRRAVGGAALLSSRGTSSGAPAAGCRTVVPGGWCLDRRMTPE